MSTTVIDTLSWCKHNVFASSMMQTQCICIIMTILDSSSLMFTHGAGGTHYASKFIDPHGSQDQPSAQEFTKYMGSRPQLRHSNQPWWLSGEVVVLPMGAVAAPIRVQHKAFNPGRAREHEILPVVPMVRFTWERPALKSLVNSVANSRKMTIIDGKTMFLC